MTGETGSPGFAFANIRSFTKNPVPSNVIGTTSGVVRMPYFERKPYGIAQAEAAMAQARPEQKPAERMSDVASRVLKSETGGQPEVYGPFRCARTCEPGSQESITLSLSADDDPMELQFRPEEMRNPEGASISSSQVTVFPDKVSLQAGSDADVKVTLTPPPEAVPGLYSGRILAEGTEPAIFRIEFEVALPA